MGTEPLVNKYDSIFVTDVMKELLMWKVFMITFERRVLREIERKVRTNEYKQNLQPFS